MLLLFFASLAVAVTVVEKHVLSDASEPTRVRYNFTWPCAPLPTMPAATDARRLRAQDIKVVMALGDSMTAGFAMRAEPAYDVWDLWRGLHEFRGSVFSVGGDAGYVTLPNFIAHYRQGQVPVGASVGITLPLDAVRWQGHIVQPHVPDLCRLNAAQSMAKIGDVPAQVTYLQQLLQTYAANGTIDFQNDWKLLTILIGANNVCGSCNNGTIHDPVYFGQTLDQILAEVTTTIPRVFVNVVTMFNISQVFTVHSSSEYCTLMWDTLASHECGCMTDPQSTPETRRAMDLHSVAFNQQIYNVVSKYNTGNSSFHVAAQPFTERMRITETDELSALECFHPSLLANAGFAAALWNNMMEPPGKKETLSVHHVSINCPNLNTFFQ